MDQDGIYLMENLISSYHQRCFADFGQVLSSLQSPNHLFKQDISFEEISNEFDRYKLWCSNVGAAHSGLTYRMSLDYRLREAPSHKKIVGDILDRLAETLERTASLLRGESQPFRSQSFLDDIAESLSDTDSDSIDGEENEELEAGPSSQGETNGFRQRIASIRSAVADINLEDIQGDAQPLRDIQSLNRPQGPILEIPQLLHTLRFTITCLYRIPIRRPAIFDERKLAGIDLSSFEPFDSSYVEERCPAASVALKQRLKRMISRRRRLLYYRARHYESIKFTLPSERKKVELAIQAPDAERLEAARPSASEKNSSKPSDFTKATTFNPADFPMFPIDPMSRDNVSVAESLPSTNPSLWTQNQKIYAPPRIKGLHGDKSFLCPYCFVICEVKSDEAWKRHVLRDLEPYVCTFTHCDMEDHQFEDRNDWYEHELQNHRIEWCCTLDGHPPCSSPSEFILHLQENHPSLLSSLTSQDTILQFQRPAQKCLKVCPFCSKPAENIKRHVSHHMDQMALYVLGGNNQEDSEPCSDASCSARKADSSASMISDDDSIDWEHQQPVEVSDLISSQHDILGEQTTVPDAMEVSWANPIDLLATLSLTATIMIFLNLASRLTNIELVYPESVPPMLTGLEVPDRYLNEPQSAFLQLYDDMENQNTFNHHSQIERDLGGICNQALNLCQDLLKHMDWSNAPSDMTLGASTANSIGPTPIPLKNFASGIQDLRRQLQLDILLSFRENPYMLNGIESHRVWEHSSIAGMLFDVIVQHGPEPLLLSLDNSPKPQAEFSGLSFLFSVNELTLNPKYPVRRSAEVEAWLPPVESRGFLSTISDQILYRWRADAELTCVDRQTDGQWQNPKNTTSLTVYRETGVFWCNPMFLTSMCDPSNYDMLHEVPYNRWWPITFEHDGSTSRIQESGEHYYLRGTGNKWITDLGLRGLLRPPNSPGTLAMAGNMGTIIGLIALSCPAGKLSSILLEDQAWQQGYWHGHQQGPGRTNDPRGVMVTIYLDDENPSSTRENLEAEEAHGGPLLRALD